MNKGAIYKFFYSRWPAAVAPRTPGYTVLLPVPGDLPVFLKIAIEVVAAQQASNRVETLVIADHATPEFEKAYESYCRDWHAGPIRLVKLRPVSRFLCAQMGYPGLNHWMQLIHGIYETRSTHALLHDADLFISDPTFLDRHYRLCTERQLACLGVNEVWDAWFKQNGWGHLTATWELMFEIEWARKFKPWQHRGHDDVLEGKAHMFDTMLLPQCITPPERIARHEGDWGLIHFNNVISTYRWFHQNPGPFEDQDFRLLLIRLLIDAWDDSGWKYDLPPVAEMVRGLTDASSRITYVSAATSNNYPIFRAKLQQLMDSGTIGGAKIQSLRDAIAPFDEEFQWQAKAQ